MLIAQITDLHAGASTEVGGRLIDTLASVREAVAHLNELRPGPDAVIVTGDLVAEETRAMYDALALALRDLAAPFFVLPGNHDERGLIREVFGKAGYLPSEGEFLHYTREIAALRLIALDTHDPGRESGLLCAERLDWVERTLAADPDKPTLIAMHHPPFVTGIAEFDRIGLQGREDFGDIVRRHSQIRAIACGHVHRDVSIAWNGTMAVVTPSTGYQYALHLSGESDFERVAEPRACRLFFWNPDAGLVTHVSYF
jgi:3',5'-cyclic AMP phosphodiesterase CpdA